ncbi:sugar transferase [Pseudonocardia sp.]|uniref:sugar transferase n=1 Tax=Pseudonocardia sp. TaxID=60912 RepID=UPI003D12B195
MTATALALPATTARARVTRTVTGSLRLATTPAAHIVGSRIKRTLDLTGALFGLILTAPLLALAALAVRLEGGPGVIYRQERVGLGGATFTLYKLRSLRPVANEDHTTWNIAHDTRLGPVGRLIRKTSIDELPQLWNVLRGDMTLVGPRPERPHFVDQFTATIPGYADRHRALPGLTGLAVVHGLRGDTSIPLRAHYDNLYIDTWTPTLDITIIFRTLGRVLLSGS